MNYYCIDYCLRNEDTMIYSHLPVNYLVTTDIDEANKWFDLAVKEWGETDLGGFCYSPYFNKFEPIDYLHLTERPKLSQVNERIILMRNPTSRL